MLGNNLGPLVYMADRIEKLTLSDNDLVEVQQMCR